MYWTVAPHVRNLDETVLPLEAYSIDFIRPSWPVHEGLSSAPHAIRVVIASALSEQLTVFRACRMPTTRLL